MKIQLDYDLKDVEIGLSTIPSGTYRCQIGKVPVIANSKSSGKPMMRLEFTIISPVEAQRDGTTIKTAGRILFRDYSLQKQAAGFLKEFLVAAKAISAQQTLTSIDDQLLNSLLGREVQIVVSEYEEEYPAGSGTLTKKNKIVSILPVA